MLQLHQVVTAAGEAPTDLQAAPGETVFLIGPSGGARTRLLSTVAGILRPRSGRIELDGNPLRRHDVGVVDEDRSLLPALTAMENVVTRPLAGGSLGAGRWRAAADWLSRLDLPESSLHNLAEQLSGGQQQRVAIARALMNEPAVLCLDNPVSELDDTTAELVWGVLADAARRGCIVLVGLPQDAPSAIPDHIVHVAHIDQDVSRAPRAGGPCPAGR